MFVKFYDRLDLSRARLDDVLTVPANRAKALDVARERHLPRQSLTRATTRMGFWVYVFQLGADVQLGTVTLAGAQPGPENVVTLPVRQLDRYTTPGMPLTETAGLLAAVAEDYPPTALTALLADSLTKVLDLWTDARRNGRPTIDIRDLDRAVTSELAPRHPRLAHRRRLPTPPPSRHGLARTRSGVNTMTIDDPTTATPSEIDEELARLGIEHAKAQDASTSSPPASSAW